MTDQIYYKVQYPLKKAINMIKAIDPEDPLLGEDDMKYIEKSINDIDNFLSLWEEEGKDNLQEVIKRLRKIQ
ncbi:MAG: hypothetical protein ACLFPF_00905 [Halanaerobiales bacterium]